VNLRLAQGPEEIDAFKSERPCASKQQQKGDKFKCYCGLALRPEEIWAFINKRFPAKRLLQEID
jgi:ferredoxin-thioredoxin reductase catalytic subunit